MNRTASLSLTSALMLALALGLAGWAMAAQTACPDAALGETSRDCPWAGVARALIADAEAGKDVGDALAHLLPDLNSSLKSDAKRGAWKQLWGKSINYDELAHGVIVHPAILKALADKLRIPMGPMTKTTVRTDPSPSPATAELKSQALAGATDDAGHGLVHAGMEHTYGYLFSVLKTSFGYKRARWVNGEIAQGFGLAEGLISPRPSEGTLFANVTYLAGNIAFRNEPARLAILKKGAADLPKALRDFDFASLKPIRLEETVTAKDETGDVRTVSLRTDLVPFKNPQKDTHLLVYSIHDPSRGGSALITAFPVEKSFVEMVLKPEDLGEGKPVKTRYNGFVEGISGKALTGTRKVLK